MTITTLKQYVFFFINCSSDIPVDIKENVDDHFEFQEEEFPQLSNPNKVS